MVDLSDTTHYHNLTVLYGSRSAVARLTQTLTVRWTSSTEVAFAQILPTRVSLNPPGWMVPRRSSRPLVAVVV